MKNIIVLDGRDRDYLVQVLNRAQENDQKVSITIDTGSFGGIQVKRGESMWTPPFGRLTP